jgi:hypothetical protein
MNSLMRPNPVRARLQAGGTGYGTMAFEFFLSRSDDDNGLNRV